MRTLPQTETPFWQMLLDWAVDRTSRALATIRPKHLASQIATAVAASGNPAGA
jgi:hypothetical protein